MCLPCLARPMSGITQKSRPIAGLNKVIYKLCQETLKLQDVPKNTGFLSLILEYHLYIFIFSVAKATLQPPMSVRLSKNMKIGQEMPDLC